MSASAAQLAANRVDALLSSGPVTETGKQNVKVRAQEIRNRLATGKAEALGLKNLAQKNHLAPQNFEPALSAAA